MSNVVVRVVFLFISLIFAVSAEDFPLTGDLPSGVSRKPSKLSFPAVTDGQEEPSPVFGIGISTPNPICQDSTSQITYSDDPKHQNASLKKRKGGVLDKMTKAEGEEEDDDKEIPLTVSVAPTVSPPPFGSPSHTIEGGKRMRKSHTMLLGDLENLALFNIAPPPSAGDVLGDLSESTALDTEEEDD